MGDVNRPFGPIPLIFANDSFSPMWLGLLHWRFCEPWKFVTLCPCVLCKSIATCTCLLCMCAASYLYKADWNGSLFGVSLSISLHLKLIRRALHKKKMNLAFTFVHSIYNFRRIFFLILFANVKFSVHNLMHRHCKWSSHSPVSSHG